VLQEARGAIVGGRDVGLAELIIAYRGRRGEESSAVNKAF
jgi:hypothetical protein